MEMAFGIALGVPQADGRIMAEPSVNVAVAADAFASMTGLPLAANVHFMTVMATDMPYPDRR
ncbi:MAG: hypothetical protein ABW192_04080 [Sphingobium sp.]